MTKFRWFSLVFWLWYLVTLMLVLATNANAQAVVPSTYYGATLSGFTAFALEPASACQRVFAKQIDSNPYVFKGTEKLSASETACLGWRTGMTVGNTTRATIAQLGTCPVARPFFIDATQTCVAFKPPETCLPETTTGSVTWKMFKGTTVIYNPWAEKPGAKNGMGCKVEVVEVEECYTLPKSADPDSGYCTFKTKQTGGLAENGAPDPNRGGDITDADKARDSLPPTEVKNDGACPRGTVNAGLSASGIPMCIGNGTKPSNSPAAPPKVEVEKNETLPDGSTQNTKSVTTKNADGSTTTVKTVTVTKQTGEKEITQEKNTTDTPTGRPGKETETPDKQNDMCKQNPNLAICKNSTVGGKCGETTCMGDAIQCAMLRSTAILQCKAEKDEADLKASPLAAKGQSAMDGKDMEGLPGPKNGLVVNVASMKSEGWLGNGAAFEDVSVNLRGHEILIPLSKWSSYLLPFRYMLMIIASLISYRILAGAVLKE